jgi:hypothetical protein
MLERLVSPCQYPRPEIRQVFHGRIKLDLHLDWFPRSRRLSLDDDLVERLGNGQDVEVSWVAFEVGAVLEDS